MFESLTAVSHPSYARHPSMAGASHRGSGWPYAAGRDCHRMRMLFEDSQLCPVPTTIAIDSRSLPIYCSLYMPLAAWCAASAIQIARIRNPSCLLLTRRSSHSGSYVSCGKSQYLDIFHIDILVKIRRTLGYPVPGTPISVTSPGCGFGLSTGVYFFTSSFRGASGTVVA